MTEAALPIRDTSPRAAGPAGAQFEAKVATHFALALLAQTEARGLPGAIVDRIEFQRRGLGHPLDDIIVMATSPTGELRCLEVQAKRSMAFTEHDANFAAVVAGIVEGRKKDAGRRFAVALERTTGTIENGVQEALELSRHATDAPSFMTLLTTPGRGNADMRRFISALRKHLADHDCGTDAILFDVAKSLSVMVFDYARPGSNADYHDRARAHHLATGANRASHYDVLFGLILRIDAIGGETNRDHLIAVLHEHGIGIEPSLNLAKARERIEEHSRLALSDIKATVNRQRLDRAHRRRQLEELLDEAASTSRVVEITGPGGAGKSGLLKAVAEGRQMLSRVLVLAPDRTPPGGWPALRNQFAIDATAEQFLQDLSCDGGGLICIDGLDRFRVEGQRKTVIDVLSSALKVQSVSVLFTARPGWEEETAVAFGEDLMAALKAARQIYVEGLDDTEAADLAASTPALAPLLHPDHPAKALARNPFILRRLVSTRLKSGQVWSEAELSWDWWTSGAHVVGGAAGDSQARRRVLLNIARGLLDGQPLVSVATQDANAVATLITDDVLVQIATDRVKFTHDLFADWAIACALAEDPQSMKALPLGALPPFWLSRGFELACRRLAESDNVDAWPALIRELEGLAAKSGWTALALLALVRSEHVATLLTRYSDQLLEGEGVRAASLIRRVIASHGQPAENAFKAILPAGATIPKGLILPAGPQWLPLIVWCLGQFERLPPAALAATISLFEGWLTLATFGEKTLSPLLLERFADVLVADIAGHDRPLPRSGAPLPKIKYPAGRDALETARTQLALYARISPSAATRYLSAITKSRQVERHILQLLEFPGHLPSAAPAAFCAALLNAVKHDDERGASTRQRGLQAPSMLEGPFVLGRCGVGLFSDLLAADRKSAIDTILALVAMEEGQSKSTDGFVLTLAGQERRVAPAFSYGWSRGNARSTIVALALRALEASAHNRIDAGEPLNDVVRELLGDGRVSGAVLLVIVDLVLSHSPLNGPLLAELVASPELLAMDATRSQHDAANAMAGGKLNMFRQGRHASDAAVQQSLAERKSRTLALHDVISQLALRLPDSATDTLRAKLTEACARLAPWTDASIDWTSERFMATHALRRASKANYDLVTETDANGKVREGWSFRWPEEQARWSQERTSGLVADNTAFTRSLALRMAMDDDKNAMTITAADAEAVLLSTADAAPGPANELYEPNDAWLSRVAAAAFLARSTTDATASTQRPVLTEIFDQALQQERGRVVPNLRYDVMYDAQALAITGYLYLSSRDHRADDRRTLLDAVSRHSASAAAAFSHHPQAARNIGEGPLRAAIRLGLEACAFVRQKNYDEDQTVFDTRHSRLKEIKSARLTAELQWCTYGGKEPAWPSPPQRRKQRRKRSLRLPGGEPTRPRVRPQPGWQDCYFDDRTAAVWLRTLNQATDGSALPALLDANRAWLINANGRGDEDEDDTDLEQTWTYALFECAAMRAKVWTESERVTRIFELLDQFSDAAFIETAAAFLVKSDLNHIEGGAGDTQYLVDLRTRLWARLKTTTHWMRHCQSPRGGMEIHLSELVLAFFCKIDRGFGNPTAYTKGLKDEQIIPLLPVLTEIAVASAPCPSIARLYLDVLGLISPQQVEPFLLRAATSWLVRADQRFWNELGIGRRVCALAERAAIQPPAQQWTEIAEAIATTGVVAGEALKQAIRPRD